MMGERTVMQEALFYGFRLEDHIPAEHLLRSIDRFVDLSGIRDGTVKRTSIWLAGDIPNGKSLVAARWAAVQNGSISRTEDVFEGSVFCPNQIGKGGARYSDNTR